jgi:hypothetical protein
VNLIRRMITLRTFLKKLKYLLPLRRKSELSNYVLELLSDKAYFLEDVHSKLMTFILKFTQFLNFPVFLPDHILSLFWDFLRLLVNIYLLFVIPM